MKKLIITWSITAILLILGAPVNALDIPVTQDNALELTGITDNQILIAHHFGARPEWGGPDDLDEFVHGGTYDPDEEYIDPNGKDFPEIPESRPDEEPGQGQKGQDSNGMITPDTGKDYSGSKLSAA